MLRFLAITLTVVLGGPALAADRPATVTGDEAEETAIAAGWAGPDLDAARDLARQRDIPILLFLRYADCPPCDVLEQTLFSDAKIAPLTEWFVRLRIPLETPAGTDIAWQFQVKMFPTIIIIGPDGKAATRRTHPVPRSWLLEQLHIFGQRRTRARAVPAPTEDGLRASLQRLEKWGDLEGAEMLRGRLGLEPVGSSSGSPVASAPQALADFEAQILAEADPTVLRQRAFDLALALEGSGQVRSGVELLWRAADEIGPDPLCEARAGYLAARHGIDTDLAHKRLSEAREANPASVPQLMALSRVAETIGRLYQAFHLAQVALVYAPDDAWVSLEVYRLRRLVKLNWNPASRDST